MKTLNLIGHFEDAYSFIALHKYLVSYLKDYTITVNEIVTKNTNTLHFFLHPLLYADKKAQVGPNHLVYLANNNTDFDIQNIIVQNNALYALSKAPYKYVVPFGVDIDYFTPNIKIAVVATYRESKCGGHILELLKREGLDYFTFYFVGKRWEQFVLPKSSAKCIKLGFISDHDLRELYRSINYLLVPTSLKQSEGGPYVVLEAMACNTPIIARNIGFAGQIEAILYNDGNDLYNILITESTKYRNQILASSWEICVSQMKEVFDKVLETANAKV